MDRNSNSKDILDMEASFEVQSLRQRVTQLSKEVDQLKQVIIQNDLGDEIEGFKAPVTDEEYICVNEIAKLKQLSDKGMFTENEAKILDILYKNLRAIRGQSPVEKSGKAAKKADVQELFKIVEGSKA